MGSEVTLWSERQSIDDDPKILGVTVDLPDEPVAAELDRPDTAHAVWWCFQQGTFAGWYVNLETPYLRRPDSVDTTDHVLDIVVTPQRQWEWKDADEFDERTGDPLYFDRAIAETIRSEGHRLTKLIEAGESPFDGTHTGFRPDPDWPTLRLTNTLDFPSRRSA